MVGDSVKFDPDASSPRPPNLGVMNEDGNVLPRRKQKESDIHAWNDLSCVFNPATVSGKIHQPDGIRTPFVIGIKGSRQGDGKSLIAALDHDLSGNGHAPAIPPTDFPLHWTLCLSVSLAS